MPSTESYQLLLAAAAACEDKKAEDIRILALDPTESGLTDYFLICNGTNDRQNVAITDEIELRLKREFCVYPNSVEGRRQGEWILMDYVDFIVHVFSAEKRAHYGLERMRRSATTISVAELSAELKELIASTRRRTEKAVPEKIAGRKTAAEKAATGKAAVGKIAGNVAERAAKKSAGAAAAPTLSVRTKKDVGEKAASAGSAAKPVGIKRAGPAKNKPASD